MEALWRIYEEWENLTILSTLDLCPQRRPTSKYYSSWLHGSSDCFNITTQTLKDFKMSIWLFFFSFSGGLISLSARRNTLYFSLFSWKLNTSEDQRKTKLNRVFLYVSTKCSLSDGEKENTAKYTKLLNFITGKFAKLGSSLPFGKKIFPKNA